MGRSLPTGRAVLFSHRLSKYRIPDPRIFEDAAATDERNRERQAGNGGIEARGRRQAPFGAVALARALALDPAIVFLDEPTSSLDPIAAREFGVLIRTLQRTLGLTVFMVTHEIEALRTICDRVAALAGGRIVAIGSMSQVLEAEDPWVKSYFRGVRSAPPSAPATP
jgi:ABC-type phosphate transport system ATPase subunit